jgi:hypothetical protein
MVGGERVQLRVEIHIGSIDPDPWARGLNNFHIGMDLCHRDCQRGTAIDNRMLAEEDDLAGG